MFDTEPALDLTQLPALRTRDRSAMGNALSCLEQCRTQQENNQRLLFLQKGAHVTSCAVFKRKKYVLGLSTGTEQIHMKLSSDEQTLLWKVHELTKELTRIDLNDVNLIKTQGTLGFSVISQKGDTLLDLEAENEDVRNNWVRMRLGSTIRTSLSCIMLAHILVLFVAKQVTNLQLLCEDSGDIDTGDAGAAASPDAASKFRKMVEEKAKKQAYWAKRTQELEDRKREAEEKKKQFSGTGLKYTAIALANRS